MGYLGNFEDGEAICEKGLRFASKMDNLYTMGFAEVMYGFLFTAKGDGEKAVEHSQNAIRYGEEGQIIPMLGMAWGVLGWGYYLLGHLESALKHAERAIEIQSDAGIPFLLSLHYWLLGMVHFDSGDLQNAQSCVEEALRLAQNNNEKWVEGSSLALLGRILGRVDISQSHTAEEFILQGMKMLDELKMKPWSSQGYLYLGELYADTGQREKALEILKKAEAAFREMGMDYYLRRTQEVLERIQG